jgi:phytoene dehydrogenase-like protein
VVLPRWPGHGSSATIAAVGANNQDGGVHEAIVVGAGPAGLSAAALQEGGFESIVLESSGAVGARSRSRYEELRLSSWRVMSNLQGFRMPRSYGRFPARDDFITYLEESGPRCSSATDRPPDRPGSTSSRIGCEADDARRTPRLGSIHARRILRAATRRRASATRRDASAPLAASDGQTR